MAKNNSLFRKIRRLVKGDTHFDFSQIKVEPVVQEPLKQGVEKGAKLLLSVDAAKIAAQNIPSNDKGIRWGGIHIPSMTHFVYVGQTGSGKTLSIKLLMEDVLREVGNGRRALIYNPKGELIPWLYGLLGDNAPIKILNPFDARCAVWDMSKDILDPAHAQTVATIFCPDFSGLKDQDFFERAAKALVSGVMESFILNDIEREEEAIKQGKEPPPPLQWDFRDVCLALRDKNTIKEILGRYSQTRNLIEHYVDRTKDNNDVLATVSSRMRELEIVAAAWHDPDRKRPRISLREFRDDPKGEILILGDFTESKAPIAALNRFLFERLSQVLLNANAPEVFEPKTWIILDEFQKLGQLKGVDDLFQEGRSKGVRVVLGFQTIEKIIEVYQSEQMPDILMTQAKAVAFLRCIGKTAQFASEHLMKQLVWRESKNISTAKTTGDWRKQEQNGSGWQLVDDYVVRPDAFYNELPEAGYPNGVGGYYLASAVGNPHQHTYTWNDLAHIAELSSTKPEHKPFEERTGRRYQFLSEWDDDDRARLFPKNKTNDSQASTNTPVSSVVTKPTKSDEREDQPEAARIVWDEPTKPSEGTAKATNETESDPPTPPKRKPSFDELLDYLDERDRKAREGDT